jgi:hypothetical protein
LEYRINLTEIHYFVFENLTMKSETNEMKANFLYLYDPPKASSALGDNGFVRAAEAYSNLGVIYSRQSRFGKRSRRMKKRSNSILR